MRTKIDISTSLINCSHNIVRVIKYRRLRWARHVAKIQDGRSAFKMLVGKPTGRTLSGMPRRRWEDNIRMDFKNVGTNTKNWIDSTQDSNY